MSATSNRDETTTGSTESFITALVVGVAVFAAQLALFVWFHKRQKKVYEPRTYLDSIPEDKRAKELPANPIKWFATIWATPSEEVLRLQGLDAYLFTRLLRMFMRIFVPFFFLTWVILMPVTAIAPNQGQPGLNRFVIGNVGTTVQPRLAAHLIVCWVLTFWVFYLIYEEVVNYVQIKHEFLSSPAHQAQSRSRTVLLTKISKDMMSEEAIRELAGPSGQVEKIWLIRNVKEVNEVFDNRLKACNKLEAAEGKILSLAAKRVRKGKASAPKTEGADVENGDYGLINGVVPAKKRPTHRLGKIPFFGTKVDSIDHSIEEIKNDSETLEKYRSNPEKYELASSAIIRFSSQYEAYSFTQSLRGGSLLKSAKARLGAKGYPDIASDDIIWKNLVLNSKLLPPKKAISWSITAVIILFWAIPVAFIGSVSNLSGLCSTAIWLAWLCRLPSPVIGILQGALPPVLLAVLFMLLPIILRLLCVFEGIPLVTLVDLSIFKRYWIFLIIHGFLIVTISGSLTSALAPALQNPQDAPSILAAKLPQSATFFLTYLITTALSNAAAFLTQAVPLVILKVMRILGAATPRKIYNLEYGLKSTPYFQLMPNVDLLVVLGLVYSIIQPIITLLALVAFTLYYVAFKYLFVWVYAQPPSRESNGIYFPRSITHVFTGLYIQQICLIGLFFLSTNAAGSRSAIPQGALMIVLLILTIAFQLYLKWKFPTKDVSLERIPSNSPEKKVNNDGQATLAAPTGELLEQHELEYEFDPPSMWEKQQPIWIANDSLGLAKVEEAKIRTAGLDVSTELATMDAKGKVEVTGRPDFIDPSQ